MADINEVLDAETTERVVARIRAGTERVFQGRMTTEEELREALGRIPTPEEIVAEEQRAKRIRECVERVSTEMKTVDGHIVSFTPPVQSGFQKWWEENWQRVCYDILHDLKSNMLDPDSEQCKLRLEHVAFQGWLASEMER